MLESNAFISQDDIVAYLYDYLESKINSAYNQIVAEKSDISAAAEVCLQKLKKMGGSPKKT